MSVARAQVQAKISRWMTKRDFYTLTGVSRGPALTPKPEPRKRDVKSTFKGNALKSKVNFAKIWSG
jgi:hypothetical protein